MIHMSEKVWRRKTTFRIHRRRRTHRFPGSSAPPEPSRGASERFARIPGSLIPCYANSKPTRHRTRPHPLRPNQTIRTTLLVSWLSPSQAVPGAVFIAAERPIRGDLRQPPCDEENLRMAKVPYVNAFSARFTDQNRKSRRGTWRVCSS
jgi:hypothetical protein